MEYEAHRAKIIIYPESDVDISNEVSVMEYLEKEVNKYNAALYERFPRTADLVLYKRRMKCESNHLV